LIVESILISNDLINQIFEGTRGPIIFVDTSKKDKIRVLLIIFCEGKSDSESSLTSTVATILDRNADARTAKMRNGKVNCTNDLVGQTGLVGHIGLIELISLIGHVCISGLVGFISFGLISLVSGFGLVGLSGISGLAGRISLIGFIGLTGIISFSLIASSAAAVLLAHQPRNFAAATHHVGTVGCTSPNSFNGISGVISFGLIASSASAFLLAHRPHNFAAATCQVGPVGCTSSNSFNGISGLISQVGLNSLISLGLIGFIGFGLISLVGLSGFGPVDLSGINGLIVQISLISLVGLSGFGLVGLSGINSLIVRISLVGLVGLSGFGLISLIGISGFGLVGLVGLSGINGISLIGLGGHDDNMSLIGLGFVLSARWLIDFISLGIEGLISKNGFIGLGLVDLIGLGLGSIANSLQFEIEMKPSPHDLFWRENGLWCVRRVFSSLAGLNSVFLNALQNATQLFFDRIPQMTKYCVMRVCENILHGYLYGGDLIFVILKGIYSFKFPKRFLEISSRDLTSSFLFCQS
jgi:hypothetical protein